MPNRRGLTVALKTPKKRQVLSSQFIWKNNSPVVIVSNCSKPNKNFSLVPTTHSEEAHKKHLVIDFNNCQRWDGYC